MKSRDLLNRSQNRIEGLGKRTDRGIDKYFFARLDHLVKVRRFVIGWTLLILFLISGVLVQNYMLSRTYQTLKPVPGGIYNEGIVGTFSTANPVYAVNNVDTAVSRLLFASLFTYNIKNQLVGDLASGYKISDKGMIYTVTLKPNLTWQDGYPITSKDVLFTYHLIQNPNAQSPLQSSWQGINITAPNSRTIIFKLPNILASFPYNMTNGILPAHILSKVSAVNMRSISFNTLKPIGSGPFKWSGIQVSGTDPLNAEEKIALIPFNNYQGGRPKLDAFVIHAYASKSQIINAFQQGRINSISGISHVPKALKNISGLHKYNFILTAGTYVFFKTTKGVLSDLQVRKALILGANVPKIISHLGFKTIPVTEPLLKGQLAFNPTYQQASYNLTLAKQLLHNDGWITGKNGIRYKNGVPLTFTLTASRNSQYAQVTQQLVADWRRIGVNVQILLQPSASFSISLQSHNYQAVLDGISIGVDPDVFVYWDSTQADVRSFDRLNFSDFNNSTADLSLEAGRTRLNSALRVIKYQPFLQAWQQNAPALGLYQPRSLYLTNGYVYGLNNTIINTPTGRYRNVQNWEIRRARVTNPG